MDLQKTLLSFMYKLERELKDSTPEMRSKMQEVPRPAVYKVITQLPGFVHTANTCISEQMERLPQVLGENKSLVLLSRL